MGPDGRNCFSDGEDNMNIKIADERNDILDEVREFLDGLCFNNYADYQVRELVGKLNMVLGGRKKAPSTEFMTTTG